MAALITKAAIGTVLLTMFVAFAFLLLVDLGNEYDVALGEQYDDRFGIELQNDGVVYNDEVRDISINSTELYEEGNVDQDSFDAGQNPGAVDATENLVKYRDVLQDFSTDFQAVGFSFSPIITYALFVILGIGLLVSSAYVFFKVIP